MNSTLYSRNRSDEPFPRAQLADVSFVAVPPKVGVIARCLQGGNDVNVFATQRADAPVDFRKFQLAALCTQFAPATLELVMLGRLLGRAGEVIQDRAQGDGSACPFGERTEFGKRPRKDRRAADQKDETEQPAQVSVQLDVAGVQLDGVVDVELCFVMGALAAHELTPLFGFLAGWRCRRVTVRRHLGSEVFWLNVHEDSLLVFWMLGSATILACESSSIDCGSAA